MRLALIVIALSFLACGCQHPGKKAPAFDDGDDMDWQDLMTQSDPARPAPSLPQLSRLAMLYRLSRVRLYEQGIYGKKGAEVMYLTTTPKMRHPTRLYWTKVKVLSEMYGCFMRQKRQVDKATIFTCRDGRHVVFWDIGSSGWNGFKGAQYDRYGRQLYVDRGRIEEIMPRMAGRSISLGTEL